MDIRDGIANRKRFYSVEARKPDSAFTDDIAYFKNEEDAKLFIASLDLLDACKAMLAAWEGYEMLAALDIDIQNQVREAIAKAEGR